MIVVTWRRAVFVRRCLESLLESNRPPDEIIVVDASEDHETRDVVSGMHGVLYVHFAGGAGHMTTARNEGLLHARGDVIAFLDDDVSVHPAWSTRIRAGYDEPDVDALAGRTLNGVVNEATDGVSLIGRLLTDGRITGHFAAEPPAVVDVDHGIGANMSFRRQWLKELGGFRDIYPGTAMREDTDIFFRLKVMGRRTVFDPDAVVDHLPAPHVKGQRFDLRYTYYAERNHVVLLATNFGLASPLVRSYVRCTLAALPFTETERRRLSRVARAIVRCFGLLVGTAWVLRTRSSLSPPRRTDQTGEHIRAALGRFDA